VHVSRFIFTTVSSLIPPSSLGRYSLIKRSEEGNFLGKQSRSSGENPLNVKRDSKTSKVTLLMSSSEFQVRFRRPDIARSERASGKDPSSEHASVPEREKSDGTSEGRRLKAIKIFRAAAESVEVALAR